MITLGDFLPAAPNAQNDVFALIALIAHPEACKKRLQELAAKGKELDDKQEEMQALSKKLEKQQAVAEKARKEAAALVDAHKDRELELSAQAEKHDARDVSLAQAEKMAAEEKGRIERQSEQLKNDTIAMVMREEAVIKREAQIEKREKEHKAKEADYDRRVAKLKEFVHA